MVITIRPKIFPATAYSGEGSAEVTAIEPPAEYKSTVTELAAKEEGQIDLKEADIIITGGRGDGGPEGFEPLAGLLTNQGSIFADSARECNRIRSTKGAKIRRNVLFYHHRRTIRIHY